jgi:hypothetical protein
VAKAAVEADGGHQAPPLTSSDGRHVAALSVGWAARDMQQTGAGSVSTATRGGAGPS